MMRVLMNELEPFEGEAGIGYNVNVGYYAQNQDDILVKTDTVYDTLDKVAVGDVRFKLRDILAAFLFRGEAVLMVVVSAEAVMEAVLMVVVSAEAIAEAVLIVVAEVTDKKAYFCGFRRFSKSLFIVRNFSCLCNRS